MQILFEIIQTPFGQVPLAYALHLLEVSCQFKKENPFCESPLQVPQNALGAFEFLPATPIPWPASFRFGINDRYATVEAAISTNSDTFAIQEVDTISSESLQRNHTSTRVLFK